MEEKDPSSKPQITETTMAWSWWWLVIVIVQITKITWDLSQQDIRQACYYNHKRDSSQLNHQDQIIFVQYIHLNSNQNLDKPTGLIYIQKRNM